MKTTLITKIFFPVLALMFIALAAVPAGAECLLYKGQFGYDVLAHVQNNVVLKERFNFTSVSRIEDSLIYDGQYSYNVLAHFDSGLIYKDRYGYTVIGRIDGEKVYDSQFGYNVIARSEGCTKEETAAAGASLLLKLL